MNFQMFSQDPSEHAPFSPSSPSWLSYSDEDIINAWKNKYRAAIGTDIHEWASVEISCRNKHGSVRDVAGSIKHHIHEKYKRNPDYRELIFQHLKYLPNEVYSTVKSFVNDAVAFDMETEKKIGYSFFFNGTADALKFDNKFLRVFDLKTGTTPAKPEQLYIYCAEYCLEHSINPMDISFEIRIYQNDEIFGTNPNNSDILAFMDNIVHKNKVLMKFEGVTLYGTRP